MRICLTTLSYPPNGTGGIPRQRHILAKALVRLGHEVHVITQGKRHETTRQNGVIVHTIPFMNQELTFTEKYPALNYRLTHSLGIQEQIRVLNQERRMDVLDVPLWGLEGFVPVYASTMPVVLWLQTSFAQLVAMGHQPPRDDNAAVIALEKESLRRANGIIADSKTVLSDFENLYGLSNLQERSCVVHLGLPDIQLQPRPNDHQNNTIEALLVGRLETRKGTPLIFEILPELLSTEKRLHIRFIGADNSLWDGFYKHHGQTYPEYFHNTYPGLRGRVIFEGVVSEKRLIEAYYEADIMLVPSIYESFGIIYLEAMRAGLPIVTFATGAAPEIFPQGENHGAVLVPVLNVESYRQAVQDLIQDDRRRRLIGSSGRERFASAFLDTQMAERTAEYYRAVSGAEPKQTLQKPRRIFQVMEALDAGDAVSTIALNNAELIQEIGAGGSILSRHTHASLTGKSLPVNQFDLRSNTALIFHYWNYSYLKDFARSFTGPKAIHFHNITPPGYFSPDSPGYEATSKGYAQLPVMVNMFNLLIGDSAYNLEVCKPYLNAPKPAIVVPPLIDADAVRAKQHDPELLEHLKKQRGLKILFVGRIARNKRQDRLIELATAIARRGGTDVWLYLVGSTSGDPQYRAELDALCSRLPNKSRVVLTGKVSDAELYTYYRAADVFVSASEHEGFGVPLIEAMALDLPVVAYAAGAVPETMGSGGLLLHEWDVEMAARKVLNLTGDPSARENLLSRQQSNLRRFAYDAVKTSLNAVVRFLQSGDIESRFIHTIDSRSE